ncbi:MAG: chloride channel protein [Chloroflexia bacterium]|nr:chloride channel protein [Chloroflexia bacterium]
MPKAEPTAKTKRRRLFQFGGHSELSLLAVLAVLVGLLAGVGTVAFHWLLGNGLLGRGDEILLRLADGREWSIPAHGAGATWWGVALVLALPPAGLLLAVLLVRLLGRGEHGHGVAGIMEAVALRGGRIRLWPALARILASLSTIAAGGSAGTVDPSVHIGATLASWLGQRLHFSERRLRVLVACGTAAGVASAFNAPIAGVFFAQEIILGEFTTTAFGLVVLSSVTASVIGRILRGEHPAFGIPAYTLRSPWEMFLYLGLGLLAGLISALYARGLLGVESLFDRWKGPFLLRTLLGGLVVGLTGWAFPRLLGVGYGSMDRLLQGERLAWGLLLLLMLLKPLLTAVTLSSGGSGGVFAPSLFIGCLLGSAYGQLANRFFPQVSAPAPAYALVGMGAVLAGAVHCPITAILLLFEMTHDYHVILPIMLSVVVSTLLSQRLSPRSVYTERMARRGLDIRFGRDVNVMEMITVEEAMGQDFDAVPPDMSLPELGILFEQSAHHGFPVVDGGGRLIGVVTLSDYRRALESGRLGTVADVCTCNPVVVHPEQSLNDALHLMASWDVGRLPVVPREDSSRIVGLLRRHDVIRAYNKGLARRLEIAHQVQQMQVASYRQGELFTLELPSGAAGAGLLVKDLRFPAGTIVVSVQRGERALIPRGDTRLQVGDLLAVMVQDGAGAARVRELLLEGKGLPRGRETRYGEYELPPSAPAVGRPIAQLGLPRDSLLVSVKRAGRTTIAYPELLLQAGDQVVVFAEEEDIPLVEHCLLGECPAPGPEVGLRNLLLLVDGSETGWAALEQALSLAAAVEGTIHGLCLLEGRLEQHGQAVLAELQRRCQQRGVDCFGSLPPGPWVEALDRHDLSEDLVMLPAWVCRRDQGQVLQQLLPRTDLPVWVAAGEPRVLGRLLAAYDGGAAAGRALRLAAQMALALRIPLDVLGVPGQDGEYSELLQRARAILSLYGLEATCLQREGPSLEQVVLAVQERDSDLVLLGVHRHGSLYRPRFARTLDALLCRTERSWLLCR